MESLFGSFLSTFSIYGVGVHVIIAVFFAVHAVRHGQPLYWLWMLFVFPFLGSVVYFFAVFLPNSRLEVAMRNGSSEALRVLNPGKELREARRAYDLTPSVRNQMRVGSALLAAGKTVEAAQEFDACLERAPVNDLDLRLAAARAKLESGQAAQAVVLLREIRTQNPDFNVQEVTLLSARALGATDQIESARAQFEYLLKNFGSFEGRVEYAIWLVMQQDFVRAKALKTEIDQTIKHWPKHAKYLNKPLIKKLNQAFNGLK